MKRIAILFSVLMYFLVVTGVTINAHFCMGKLESVSLFSEDSGKTCCCKGVKCKNCCKDKHVTIKSSSKHYVATAITVSPFSTLGETLLVAEQNVSYYSFVSERVLHPPPLLLKCPVHIQNMVFLI